MWRIGVVFGILFLVGCAHQTQSRGPAIDDVEATAIAIREAEKGGWEILDVRDPKRVDSGWRVLVMRKEKTSGEATIVDVVISADGQSTKLVYPFVPNVTDDLNRSRPPKRPFRL